MVDEERTEELMHNIMQKGDGGRINEEELEQMMREVQKVEIEVNEAKRFKINNKD